MRPCQIVGRPRVLVLTHWFPTEAMPHAYRFVLDWCDVSRRVADVVVLHLVRPGPGAITGGLTRGGHPDLPGVDVWRLAVRGPTGWKPRSLLADIRAVRRAVTVVEAQGGPVDLVHAHVFTVALHALWLRLRTGKPYVVTEHFSRLLGRDLRWFHLVQAWIGLRAASTVAPVGQSLSQAMRDRGIRARFEVLPNPVQVDEFRPGGSGSRRPLLVAVGRLEPNKGFDLLVEAFARLGPSARERFQELHIVGDGPMRDELLALARRRAVEDRVILRGELPRRELAAVMAAAAAFVSSSHVETFSVVAAEALSAGLPVVVTRSGGPEEFVAASMGVVVEPGSVDALVDGIHQVAAMVSDFDGEAARAFVAQRFSPDALAHRLGSIYARALGGHGTD